MIPKKQMCAIPFRLFSKQCHPFRVMTAAFGQNTAFMPILGPLSAPLPSWNGHSRSKPVSAVQPGCVLSRSSLVPSCATCSGSPQLPTARTLHLWPFLAPFGHKMGQNGWNNKHMLWISIQVNPNDNLKALVLAKQKLEKR